MPQRRPSGEPWGWLRSPPRSRAMVEPYVGGALHPAAWDWPPGAPLCCAAYSPRCFIIQKVRSEPRSVGAAPAAGEPRYQMVRQRRPPADVDGVETRSPRRARRTTIGSRRRNPLVPRALGRRGHCRHGWGLLFHANPLPAPFPPVCHAAGNVAVCARIARLRPDQQVLFSRCPTRRRGVWLCVFSSGGLVILVSAATRSVAPAGRAAPVPFLCVSVYVRMCVLW